METMEAMSLDWRVAFLNKHRWQFMPRFSESGMKERFLCKILIALGLSLFFSETSQGQEAGTIRVVTNQPTIKAFLQTYLDKSSFGSDKSTRFSQARIPGTPLTLVYLSGQTWCGSGGCTLLVLRSNETRFEILSKTTTVNLPVRSLATIHNGLPDIGVWVEGGGVQKGYEAALAFDGIRYPSSPSVGLVTKAGTVSGSVIIDKGNRGVELYTR